MNGRWAAIALWTAAVMVPAGVVGAVNLRERQATAVESVEPSPDFGPVPFHPAFSRDGKQITFAVPNDGAADVFVVGVDGRGLRRVATNGSPAAEPAFTADAKRVLYIGLDAERRERVSTVRADGTGRKTLAVFDGVEPSFSPDGKRVAFEYNPNSAKDRQHDYRLKTKSDVYAMNLDGTNRRRLTTTEYSDGNPTFSVDGTKIAFNSGRPGPFKEEIGDYEGVVANEMDLYIMDADGTNERRIELPAEGQLAHDLSAKDVTLFAGAFGVGSQGRGANAVGVDAEGRALLGSTRPWEDARVAPDGVTLVYVAESRFGASDIFKTTIGGTQWQQLTGLAAWYARVG